MRSAVLAAAFPTLGIGFVGVSFAFGLTVLTMAYAIGHISGCHLNPAVTVGLWAGGRFPAANCPYIIAQVIGRHAPAGVLYLIASGKPGFDLRRIRLERLRRAFPGWILAGAVLVGEIVLTFMFLMVILGATERRAGRLRGLAIGLALTLIHLIRIPVTNTSVNPARSTGPALFAGGWAVAQLWLFWVAPIVGGIVGGFAYPLIVGPDVTETSPSRVNVPPRPRDRVLAVRVMRGTPASGASSLVVAVTEMSPVRRDRRAHA